MASISAAERSPETPETSPRLKRTRGRNEEDMLDVMRCSLLTRRTGACGEESLEGRVGSTNGLKGKQESLKFKNLIPKN